MLIGEDVAAEVDDGIAEGIVQDEEVEIGRVARGVQSPKGCCTAILPVFVSTSYASQKYVHSQLRYAAQVRLLRSDAVVLKQ